ncbi:MAG: serine hydrolase domain-containing protein, partial [Acidobacteriaceae bacterium]
MPVLFLLLSMQLIAQQATSPDFSSIDRIMASALKANTVPGAVVFIGHDGHVVFHKAYGNRSTIPTPNAMTEDTIFDMASLTKPLATAVAVMQLYEQGKIGLNDAVAKYLPDFGVSGKQDITIRQLLTHYSGLPPDLPLEDPWSGKEEGFRRAFAIAPARPAGEQFVYSDINFIVLGALVEKLSGLTLDEYTRRFIMEPLGLGHTRFL